MGSSLAPCSCIIHSEKMPLCFTVCFHTARLNCHIAQRTPYDYCAQVIRTRTTNPHAEAVRIAYGGCHVVRWCEYTH